MDIKQYQRLAEKTAMSFGDNLDGISRRCCIAGLGLAGEAGEVADLIKKKEGYGKTVGIYDLIDELGDVMWYIAETATAYGLDLDLICETNIAKLKNRHGEKFNEDHYV